MRRTQRSRLPPVHPPIDVEEVLQADGVEELSGDLLVEVAAPGSDDARVVLRAYTDEVASRSCGRPATAAEVDAALEAHPSADLAPPRGLLLLARSSTAVLGCAGLRLLPVAGA